MNWGHKVLIKNCIQIFYSCINNRLIIFLENLAPLSEKSEPLLLFFFWEMLMNNQPLIQPLPPGQKKRQNSRSKSEHCHGPYGQDYYWLLKISKWEKKNQIFRNFQITTLSKIWHNIISAFIATLRTKYAQFSNGNLKIQPKVRPKDRKSSNNVQVCCFILEFDMIRSYSSLILSLLGWFGCGTCTWFSFLIRGLILFFFNVFPEFYPCVNLKRNCNDSKGSKNRYVSPFPSVNRL